MAWKREEPHPVIHQLGRAIVRARDLRGLSQRKLAGTAGVSPSHLSAIERGISWPSVEVIDDILGALGGMTLDEIFGSEIDPAMLDIARWLLALPDDVRHSIVVLTRGRPGVPEPPEALVRPRAPGAQAAKRAPGRTRSRGAAST